MNTVTINFQVATTSRPVILTEDAASASVLPFQNRAMPRRRKKHTGRLFAAVKASKEGDGGIKDDHGDRTEKTDGEEPKAMQHHHDGTLSAKGDAIDLVVTQPMVDQLLIVVKNAREEGFDLRSFFQPRVGLFTMSHVM